METLEGLDAAFLALETPTVHLHIGAVLVLGPPEGRRSLFSPGTRFVQIRRLVGSRLHLAPVLRQRAMRAPLAMHRPVWVDDPHFTLDDHVRRLRLPEPGGTAELHEVVGDLLSQPLPPDRPLWQLAVVEGLGGERTALIFKVHHALLDGVSGAELLAAFLDLSPRASQREPHVLWSPPPLPSPVELLRRAAGDVASQPAVLLGAAHRLVEAGVGLTVRNQRLGREEDRPPSPFSAPRTVLNGTVGARRCYASAELALSEVRAVGQACGATVNDVVLACVTAALRRYLRERAQVVPDSMVALVPISVRQSEPGRLGNRVSGMFVALPTGLEEPTSRLDAVARAARQAKDQAKALGADLVMEVAEAVPYALTERVARWLGAWRLAEQGRPLANLTISNIVGPSDALWCAGSRVQALYPAGPIAEGVGLNVTVLTYQHRIHVGVVACGRLVPDVERLAAAMLEEEAALVEAVLPADEAAPAAG